MEEALVGMMELEFSGCSSTSATTSAEDLNWSGWSPATDWACFSGSDDFHGQIEPMMNGGVFGFLDTPPLQDWSTSVSASSTNCPGTPADEPPLPPNFVVDPMMSSGEDVLDTPALQDWLTSISAQSSTKCPAVLTEETPAAEAGLIGSEDIGLRLVHLLMAAADALIGADEKRDLASVVLARLKEMLARGGDSSMERLAAHFTDALLGILNGASVRQHEEPPRHPGDVLEAFQLLQDMSPYVKFGHFTANQAIIEAVADERRVHIIDFDIAEGVQWASLMQALVSKKIGGSPPHLRITAVARRRSTAAVQQTGRRLGSFAASIGLPFSFGQCRLDADEYFRPAAVRVVRREVVVLNCVLHEPHLQRRSAASVGSFLSSAAALGARLVTVVEEETATAGGVEEAGFVGLFMEALNRYSAMWDALEEGFPMQGRARGTVERLVLGPMIAGAVWRAYCRRENKDAVAQGWSDWAEAAGFGRVGLSFFNICQARLLLDLFNDGYRVEEAAPNKLVLCWKSCRLISASVWLAPAIASPAASNFSF